MSADIDERAAARLRRAKIPNPNFGALVATFLLVVYGLYFVFAGKLSTPELMAETSLVPPDSLKYVGRADEVSATGLTPVELVTGAMNWLGVSLVYAYFEDLGGFGPLAFVLINGVCLYLWLSGSVALFRLREPFRSVAPLLSLVASPFLFGWVLAPNKELPTAALLVIIFRQAQRGHTGRILLLSIFATLFKVQVLVAALIYALGKNLRFRRSLALIGLSLVIPILMPLVGGLSIEHFLEIQENEINSGALFTALDKINATPFGYVVVAPIRLVANVFAGLIPFRVFSYTETADLLASLTSFTLGCLGLICLVKAITEGEIRRNMRRSSDCAYFLVCVALAFGLVPFLQVRYYWWAIPLMIAYLLRAPRSPQPRGVPTTLPAADLS